MYLVSECVVGQMNNWLPISDFANLEELCLSVWDADEPSSYLLMRSVASSCLRRVIIGIETETVRWSSFDESLASLAKRHQTCRNLVLQISTKADPERVQSFLPQAAALAGVLEVGSSKRSCD